MNAKKPFRKPGISQRKLGKIHGSSLAISCIWLFNGIIVLTLAFISGGEFLKGSFLEYSKVQHDPYDGALSPISYIPNYSREDLRKDKYRRYENFELSDFIELPKYQTEHLSQTGSDTILDRFTYIIPYMGSYRMNGLEYDGSHAGVDIRAPLGTPVLAI
jgi:murein DD-endopeptidase MepM/ murein hydrolase activator NlpD